MIANLQEYFTFEIIYIWLNLGVIPFWIMLISIPDSKINQILINSIFIPLILALTYIYIINQIILSGNYMFDIFDLYLGLDNLYVIFSNEEYLLIFWIHFLALSLFMGTWVSRDSLKYNIPKWLTIIPIILIYFSGPVGFVIYWLIRIFFSKKIGIHD